MKSLEKIPVWEDDPVSLIDGYIMKGGYTFEVDYDNGRYPAKIGHIIKIEESFDDESSRASNQR